MVGIGWVRSCNNLSDCWGHVAYHLDWCLSSLLQLVALNGFHFGPECHVFISEPYVFHEYICVLDPIYELYAPIMVRNRRSQKLQLGTPKRVDYNLRICCIHWLLMLCCGSLWQEHLNLHKFLLSPFEAGWLDKRCASSYCKHVQLPVGYMPNVWYRPRWSFFSVCLAPS